MFDTNETGECAYCGGTDTPCVYDGLVFEYVYRCLCQEYGDPWLESMIPDKEEGGWIGISEMDSWDVLANHDSPLGDCGKLVDAFAASVDHDWYRLGSEVGEDELLLWSWDSFEDRILNGPRFLFSRTEAEFGEESAEGIFGFIAELARRIGTEFIKTCDAGQILFRARTESESLTTATELGSPTRAQATPQRMSSAGVPCFYAAEDAVTAKAEIPKTPGQCVSIGEWTTTAELVYADFASELEFPSLFDYPESQKRPYVGFLREFVKRITRPPKDDLGQANSYLATQVLTEYLRYALPLPNRNGVDAIRYPSSIHESGINWVIFGQPDKADPPTVTLTETLPRFD